MDNHKWINTFASTGLLTAYSSLNTWLVHLPRIYTDTVSLLMTWSMERTVISAGDATASIFISTVGIMDSVKTISYSTVVYALIQAIVAMYTHNPARLDKIAKEKTDKEKEEALTQWAKEFKPVEIESKHIAAIQPVVVQIGQMFVNQGPAMNIDTTETAIIQNANNQFVATVHNQPTLWQWIKDYTPNWDWGWTEEPSAPPEEDTELNKLLEDATPYSFNHESQELESAILFLLLL